ncbi:MAG: marine proteobacterial sortase target protein [Rhizobiales bacterium]|nr:marine proteobacterial sortase target protein [Hyphomicrobiales bacterium]
MSPLPHLARLPVLILVVLVVSARTLFASPLVNPNDARTGSLMIKSETPGQYVEAPAVATDFDVTVTGPIIRTRLTQYFVNPANGWVEGLYVFPLPEDAAVDTLKMVVGERIIIGDVKERIEAKRIYEKAKSDGKKAALVEQHRPNLFTNSVANIGPGETVVVQIEFQATVRQSNGKFSFRLPTVVAPRFETPDAPQPVVSVSSEAPAAVDNKQQLPDAKPWLDPDDNDPVNPINITVHLKPGFKVAALMSPHHKIEALERDGEHRITLSKMDFADKDFELEWTAAALDVPQAKLFRERSGNEDYVLVQVTPPAAAKTTPAPAREAIFVIDNSGSMAGPSMVQAKASLIEALDRLQPGDTFNIVRFDDTLEVLFPTVVAADAGNISTAKRFVASLDAEGGTNMVPALAAALKMDTQSNPAAIRQVIFLTDGAISGEQQMFNLIAQRRGRSRIFMVGIGSAPNSFLMNRAAEMGRGTFTHIGAAEQVAERMAELTSKLTSPAVTGLAANFSARGVKATPDPLPDVYAGEPLYIYARMDELEGKVTLSGLAGSDNWLKTVDLTKAEPGSGIAKLWARREIANTEVNRTLGTLNYKQADAMILKLALDHQLVSRLTSLIAIDKTPARPEGTPLRSVDIPLNLPAGWSFEKVFGSKTPVKEASAFKAIAVASKPRVHDAQRLLALPEGSTPADLLLIIGLLISLAGAASVTASRRMAS